MKRITTLALVTGALLGFSAAQFQATARAQAAETQIKTDDGVIIFIVKGQEKARIDTSGLHVNGDIAYFGATIDTETYEFTDSPNGKAP